jgi:iron complex outermembrane recepter protein
MRRNTSRAGRTASALTVALCAAGAPALADTTVLDMIHVESTTIDDRFDGKRDEPSSTAAISGEQVDRAHVQHIQQLLQSIPGLTTDVLGGETVKIKIRGVENQRHMGEKPGVAVVIDGVPVFEDLGRVNIDLDNIESIRVIKGGASYLFGEDALAGAVIITTKRGAGMGGVRLAGEAGSHGYRKGLARAGHAGENFNAYVQASRREAEGWHARSGYQADYLNGKLQYYLDDASDLTFGFELSERERDEHGTVRGITQATEDPRNLTATRGSHTRKYDVELARYHLTYARDVGVASNLLLSAYHFTDDTSFWSAPMRFHADGTPVNDADLYQNANDNTQVQRGLKGEWRSGGARVAWLGGLDLRANRYEKTTQYLNDFRTSPTGPVFLAGTQTADNRTDESIYAGYAELKLRLLRRLLLTLNGRYDRLELDHRDHMAAQTLERSFDVWSWRAGTNFQATDNLDFFANVSTGFRTPTVDQLFAGHSDTSGEAAGNPDLEPERSLNLEVGLRSRTSFLGRPLEMEASVFQLERKDFILATAGQYATATSEAEETFENIGGVRNRGLELALRGEATDRIFWNLAYTLLDSRFTRYENFNLVLGNSRGAFVADCAAITSFARQWCAESYDNTGNRVPRAPRHTLNLALGARPWSGLTVTGEMHSVSSYFADELNRFRIGGHTSYNLLANYDVKTRPGITWSLFGRIDNVFDRTYYNRASAFYDNDQNGVYDWEDVTFIVNPGRVWSAGISATF